MSNEERQTQATPATPEIVADDVYYPATAPERNERGWGDVVKFGLLAVVLLVTLLVISLLRPLIFDRVLPGVLGMNNAATVRDTGTDDGAENDLNVDDGVDDDAGDPGASDTAPDDDAAIDPADTTDNGDAADGTNADDADGTVDDADADADTTGDPDTPPAVPTITYTVQPGDNLTEIAERFDVTNAEIIAANNIVNPNRILVGTELIIPQPEE